MRPAQVYGVHMRTCHTWFLLKGTVLSREPKLSQDEAEANGGYHYPQQQVWRAAQRDEARGLGCKLSIVHPNAYFTIARIRTHRVLLKQTPRILP